MAGPFKVWPNRGNRENGGGKVLAAAPVPGLAPVAPVPTPPSPHPSPVQAPASVPTPSPLPSPVQAPPASVPTPSPLPSPVQAPPAPVLVPVKSVPQPAPVPVKDAPKPPAVKPKPMPFAVMSCSRDSIRASFKELDATLQAKDQYAFEACYKDTVRGIQFHAQLEEQDGLFDFLDVGFDGVVREGGLRELIGEEAALEDAVAEALDNEDWVAIHTAYEPWKAHTFYRLKQEDAIITPQLVKLSKSVKGNPTKLGEIFNTHVVLSNFENGKEMAWFMAWNARVLAKNRGFTAMRIFVWGSQFGTTPKQWKKVLPAIKKALETGFPGYYERLEREIDVAGPGKVSGEFFV